MPTNIIFVISEGRTGSTLLCQLLTHYQNTINLNESVTKLDMYFRDKNKRFDEFLKTKNTDSLSIIEVHEKLIKDPINLIKDVSNYFDDTVIAKLHLTDFHVFKEDILNWILSQPNHKFILLGRTDFLKTYISSQISIQLNKWHNTDTTTSKVKIDINDFSEKLHSYKTRYDNIKKSLNDHGIDYLELEYDKDLKEYNNTDFINLVSPWMKRTGLDLKLGDPPNISVKRQNSNENIFDNIINIEEIEELIKNNNFILDINSFKPDLTEYTDNYII